MNHEMSNMPDGINVSVICMEEEGGKASFLILSWRKAAHGDQ